MVMVNVVEDIAAVAGNNDVPQGSKLPKSIFCSFMLYSDADPITGVNVHVAYLLNGQANGTDVPDPGTVDQFVVGNKQVVHQWKALTGNKTGGYPMAFSGLIPVPKSMRYCPLGATLILRVGSTTPAGKFCCQSIYPYYR